MSMSHPVPAASPRLAAGAFAVLALLWLLLLLVAPYLVSHSAPGSALFNTGGLVYVAGHVVCHQRADRSFHAWGVQLPVCARCFGLYAAAVFGSLVAVRQPVAGRRRAFGVGAEPASARHWPRRLALAALPTAASVALEVGGVWGQSPEVRCAAAIPLGFTVGWFVAAHLPQVLSQPRKGLS